MSDETLPPGPWDTNWVFLEPLGGGGQGTTCKVKSRTDGSPAVLKRLKDQTSNEARKRMFQEHANLKIVKSANGKVPAVFDANVDQFEKMDVPLYIAMESIDGVTLDKIVTKDPPYMVDEAIDACLDILDTLEKAHSNQVVHRDLKPENIIARSGSKTDLVLLDFGLAHNADSAASLTTVSETIDNSFLRLPERAVSGGNKRDPRSDVTSVCGLLSYLLTRHKPAHLRDGNDKPPHRRDKFGLRASLPKGESRIPLLESILDRGFMQDINLRFENCASLRTVLTNMKDPAKWKVVISPVELARKLSLDLKNNHRPTLLDLYAKNAKRIEGA